LAIALFAIAAASPSAHATPERETQDIMLEERRIKAAFESGDYEQMLALLRAAHARWPNPRYVRNMGRALEMLNRPAEALAAYEEFLRQNTDQHLRSDVERRAAELKAKLPPPAPPVAKQPPAPAAPTLTSRPATPDPPVEKASPQPAAVASTAPAPGTGEPATPRATGEKPSLIATSSPGQAQPKERVYRRGWFWVTVGGATLAVAAGITLAATLGSRDPSYDYGPYPVH